MSVLETHDQVRAVLRSGTPGVHVVKPRILFKSVETHIGRPTDLLLQMPSSEIGSITLLEGAQMASAIQLVAPEVIFEFGTYLGYSTALFALNSKSQTQILSLDIDAENFAADIANEYERDEVLRDGDTNDAYLRKLQDLAGTPYIDGLPREVASKITLLKHDSRTFDVDVAGLAGKIDFVFIDGGHDDGTVDSDTDKALEMVGDCGVIFWHDYASHVHTDVTGFVDRFAADKPLLRIESTMLAMMPVGNAARLLYQ